MHLPILIILVFLGLPQGPILYTLFFLICSNNLSNHILATIKQFAAAKILFFISLHANILADELNPDLNVNLDGHPLYKISFNLQLN